MKVTLSPLGATIAGLVALAVSIAAATSAGAQGSDLFTGFQSNSNDPIQIDATKLQITEKDDQRISVFTGNVVVRRGETVMHAEKIRIISELGDDRPEGQAFSRIVASGNVEVTSGDQTVTGPKVVVDMVKQVITMSGGVVMSQGANVITGERLVVDLVSGKAGVEQASNNKRIRGVFTPGAGNPAPPGQ